MNRKRVMSLLLVLVMMAVSVTAVCAASSNRHEWDDDWDSSIAWAFGEAVCNARSAGADTYCYSSGGTVISTSASVEATYQYRIGDTDNYNTLSAYDDDMTLAEVSFSCGSDNESIFIHYYYIASYTAYGEHSTVYTERYTGNEVVSYVNNNQ